MKQYEYHSTLPPEAVLSRLRSKTRWWFWLDGRFTPNTWFLQRRKNGTIRLILVGRARIYVFADLTLTEAEGGTDIAASVGVEKMLYLNMIILLFLPAFLAILDTGNPKKELTLLFLYGWSLVVLVLTVSSTRRQIPELRKFIEENLLE